MKTTERKTLIVPMRRGKREDARVCIHEAAHLVASCKLRLSTPRTVTVEPGDDYAGRMTDFRSPLVYCTEWKCDPKNRDACQEYDERNVVMLLSGLAAEVRRGRVGKAASTIMLFYDFWKHDPDGYNGISDVEMALDLLTVYEPDREKRERWFFRLWAQAYRLVGKWWTDIRGVAAILQERRTLDRDGIFEVYHVLKYGSDVGALNE